MRLLIAAVFLLFAWACAGGAKAAPVCSATVNAVSFGSPNLLSTTATDVTATWTATCSGMGGGTFKVCLSLAAGSGGSTSPDRLLLGPGATRLRYNLFTDAARTLPWSFRGSGGSIGGITVSNGTPSGTGTIYARLYGGQQLAVPGSHSSAFTGGTQAVLDLLKNGITDCNTGTVQGSTLTDPSFSVTADPPSGCEFAMNALSFGTKGVLQTATDAQASFSAKCTNTTSYVLSLNNGVTGTGPTARKMTNGPRSVTYGLYSNSGRTTPWGTAAGTTVAGTGTGAAQSSTVYGRVPVQTTPAPGTYTDQVVVTATF